MSEQHETWDDNKAHLLAAYQKDEIAALKATLQRVEAERDAALVHISELELAQAADNELVQRLANYTAKIESLGIGCAYCDAKLDGTPFGRDEVALANIKQHVQVDCPTHPMRQLERDLQAANQRADDAVAAERERCAKIAYEHECNGEYGDHAISCAIRKPIMPKTAYEMGRDCAVDGANETNCHFSIFSTPENTREWERGKRDAEKQANH